MCVGGGVFVSVLLLFCVLDQLTDRRGVGIASCELPVRQQRELLVVTTL